MQKKIQDLSVTLRNILLFCPWNLNSIAAHNFIKAPYLKAYLSVHEMDIICLSETYLDSSVPVEDNNL